MADAQRAPREVWGHLAVAATSMQLDDSDAVHGQTVARVKEHLLAKHEWFELRALLNEWDPIGIYDPVNDNPPDEYSCMEATLMSRLQRGQSAQEVSDYLTIELREHFGIDPRPSHPHDFAQRLVTWFAGRTP